MDAEEWPNLFFVGAGRAATTSLWSYLGQHPQIFMSKLKEPHFFSRVAPEQQRYVHDEAEYKSLFRPGRGLPFRGEASPSYLWHPDVPAAIERVQPDSRIVISLRDPIARAYSSYRLRRRNGIDRRPFVDTLRAGLSLADGERALYFRVGQYLGPVTTYLQTFPGRIPPADLRGARRRHARRGRPALRLPGRRACRREDRPHSAETGCGAAERAGPNALLPHVAHGCARRRPAPVPRPHRERGALARAPRRARARGAADPCRVLRPGARATRAAPRSQPRA